MSPDGRSQRRRWRRSGPLREPKAPNDIWGIDFKGWFRTRDGVRCDPLTVTDLSSRFILSLVILPIRTEEVRQEMEALFERYGVPGAMRSDNGTPFAGPGVGGLSRLSVDWVKAGIRLERIDPGKPFQNGSHERMHGTLKKETTYPPAATVAEQQESGSTGIGRISTSGGRTRRWVRKFRRRSTVVRSGSIRSRCRRRGMTRSMRRGR